MGIQKQLKAILMAAGAEKLQTERRLAFTLTDGEFKIVPLYWQDKDINGDAYADFTLTDANPAARVNWKSRCAGGYYYMAMYNNDTNGALLAMNWIVLNKHNYDDFDAVFDIQTYFDNATTAVHSGNWQDLAKADDRTRSFVPHVKYRPLAAKQMHFEEGILPTGKKTNPWTTPYIKALVISNVSRPSTSSVTVEIEQNYYEYSPGVSTSARATQETKELE